MNHKSLFSENKSGLIGFQFQNLNQGAEGAEETHLTSTKTSSYSMFVLENLEFDWFDLDVGGRIESVNLKNTNFERGFFPVAFSSNIKRDFFTNSSVYHSHPFLTI